MIKNDEFIEYAKVHNNYYGTPKSFVLNQIHKGNIVILEIDVQGALQVKKRPILKPYLYFYYLLLWRS